MDWHRCRCWQRCWCWQRRWQSWPHRRRRWGRCWRSRCHCDGASVNQTTHFGHDLGMVQALAHFELREVLQLDKHLRGPAILCWEEALDALVVPGKSFQDIAPALADRRQRLSASGIAPAAAFPDLLQRLLGIDITLALALSYRLQGGGNVLAGLDHLDDIEVHSCHELGEVASAARAFLAQGGGLADDLEHHRVYLRLDLRLALPEGPADDSLQDRRQVAVNLGDVELPRCMVLIEGLRGH
mmetsp:Transcript_131832/g.294998  ORF Transcript_131832/g.294998 Transcript_131832/m.294998 type:complete len:242 (-) Transcript_131832:1242-1967(-)